MGHLRLHLRHITQALALVNSAASGLTAAWAAVLIAQGLLPVINVQLVRHLVDSLVPVLGHREIPAQVLALIVCLGAVLLAGELLRVAQTWIRTRLADRVSDHITALVQNTAVGADLAFYESATYQDGLYRVQSDAQSRPVALLDGMGGLLRGGVTLLGLTGVLLRFGLWLPIGLIVSTLPGLCVILVLSARQHAWQQRCTDRERKSAYYNALVTSTETAPEIRTFGVASFFQDEYRKLRDGLRAERMNLLRQRLSAELMVGVVGHATAAASVGLMVHRAILGQISLGEVALFYQAFSQGQTTLATVMEQFKGIYSNTLFLADLFAFLRVKPCIVDPSNPEPVPAKLTDGIQLRDVTFSYPESKRRALDQLNMLVPCGKITAVVGPNGAGKSTLLKLLCRLYEPNAGCIEIDNIDLRSFRVADLRRSITALFQVPIRYAASAATNIFVGDVEGNISLERIRSAAQSAGIEETIKRLPDGYYTELIKGQGGTADLSVGEWQRIALARAFLRDAQIIVLDEPTSAMDPWAEAEWLDRFRTLAAGKTVLIITHRFTTAMKADLIYVLEQGKVLEAGSHEDLVARNGKYASSWRQQIDSWTSGSGLGPD